MSSLLRAHPTDSVLVTVLDLPAAARVDYQGGEVTTTQPVPAGHKVAIRPIANGQPVHRYGAVIGRATRAIVPGDWVHAHNLATTLTGKLDLAPPQEFTAAVPATPALADATFHGYPRADGRVGTRNEIWIIPLVGCVNRTAQRLAEIARSSLPESIDGVWAWTHSAGCSQLGEDHESTRRVLASLARHPNAGGVLLLGLGCENNTLASFLPLLGDFDQRRVRTLVCQDVQDEFAEGETMLRALISVAADDVRTVVPLRHLCIGLKCGGSDSFSGLTANPLVGAVCERLVAAGGRAILTEVPEMFGAEQDLLARAADRAVLDDAVEMLQAFRDYYVGAGQPVGENPSPGNREGGITTLEEKSLGCVRKAGGAPIVDVLRYGQALAPMRAGEDQSSENSSRPGVCLLEGPGNDMVAVTALAAAGAQIILFTTGRGTPLGGPVPTLKIATTSMLTARKPHWIDFDAGRLLHGESMEQLAEELLAQVLAVAEGTELAGNERGGHREIALWRRGVTL